MGARFRRRPARPLGSGRAWGRALGPDAPSLVCWARARFRCDPDVEASPWTAGATRPPALQGARPWTTPRAAQPSWSGQPHTGRRAVHHLTLLTLGLQLPRFLREDSRVSLRTACASPCRTVLVRTGIHACVACACPGVPCTCVFWSCVYRCAHVAWGSSEHTRVRAQASPGAVGAGSPWPWPWPWWASPSRAAGPDAPLPRQGSRSSPGSRAPPLSTTPRRGLPTQSPRSRSPHRPAAARTPTTSSTRWTGTVGAVGTRPEPRPTESPADGAPAVQPPQPAVSFQRTRTQSRS